MKRDPLKWMAIGFLAAAMGCGTLGGLSGVFNLSLVGDESRDRFARVASEISDGSGRRMAPIKETGNHPFSWFIPGGFLLLAYGNVCMAAISYGFLRATMVRNDPASR